MVLWPFRLKFGRELGTHPGRSVPMVGLGTTTPWVRGPKMGFQGTIWPNNELFGWVRLLQLAGALQLGWALQQAGTLQLAGALQRDGALQQAGALQLAVDLQQA